MRVVQVIAPGRYGGAESVAVHLAAALRHAGLESAVAAVVPPSGPHEHPFAETTRRLGIELHTIVTAPRRYDRQVGDLARYVSTSRADVLHAHNVHGNAVARCAAWRVGLPCIATFHGYLSRTRRERAYEWVDIRTLRAMDAVITVSHAAARELASRAPTLAGRLHVVPSALAWGVPLPASEARAVLALPGDCPTFGWVGRFSVEKDPDLFVRSLARMSRGTWRAVMLGDGPLEGPTASLARELGLEDRVTFAGWRPDAAALMRAFDAVVITSRREQLPTVLLEALGASVPVVSVGVGDVPLFARAGVAVTARDPDAIAGALTRLTACDAARRRLGAAGAAYVREHHDSARWADRHTALYSAHATPPRRIAS